MIKLRLAIQEKQWESSPKRPKLKEKQLNSILNLIGLGNLYCNHFEMDFNVVQKHLAEALSNKDLIDFEICLDMGADPLYMDHNNVCTYEMALSTYGSAEFVEKCLKNGCCPNYVSRSSSKAAIHYAADSGDPEIIRMLLRHPCINVNHKFQHQTAIHTLVRLLNNHNVSDIMACVEILLCYGASPLIADEAGMIPLQRVMKNPNVNHEVKGKVIEFLESFNNSSDNPMLKGNELCADIHSGKLLLESILDKDNRIFDMMLDKGLEPNARYDNKTPLECAITVGNYYALKKLPYHPFTDLNSVANPLIVNVKNWKKDSYDFSKCFYLLLKSNDININAKDQRHFTALHYAVENHNPEAIRALLRRGAFIGAITNTLAVDGISPEILQECFDNCVTSNGFATDDQNCELVLSYENLMPKSEDLQERLVDEDLLAVKFIAKSDKHRHLVEHPVISSFLRLKWSQLSFMFYASFLMYLMFAICMSTYIVLKLSGHETEKTLTLDVFWVLSWLGIVYMIVKEFMQMLNEQCGYFQSVSNYIELTMIVMAIITCSPAVVDRPHQRVIAVSTILLISVEIFLLTGSLPLYSMTNHMLMFEAVCKSFLKSFMLYSIFLVTFSLIFYILFGQDESRGVEDSSSTDFNKFSTPLGTVIKTFVMLTGEFEAGDMQFSTLYSYILFLLFVFLMTIVLYNLLNGLAVSDIQAIQGHAERSILISRINLIIRYGKALKGHSPQLTLSVNFNQFQHLYGRIMNLHGHMELDNLKKTNLSIDDIENISSKIQLGIQDQRLIEQAIDILEHKCMNTRTQKRIRTTENRLNEIDNKLKDVFGILKDMRKKGTLNL